MKRVAFVCTGNICRSPMAAALAAALDPAIAVESAGTRTMPGTAASPNAILVMAEVGIDLSTHRAQSVETLMVDPPDVVYTLEEAHAEELRRRYGGLRGRIRTLLRNGESIADPYGADASTYRVTRDVIRTAVADRARGGWD